MTKLGVIGDSMTSGSGGANVMMTGLSGIWDPMTSGSGGADLTTRLVGDPRTTTSLSTATTTRLVCDEDPMTSFTQLKVTTTRLANAEDPSSSRGLVGTDDRSSMGIRFPVPNFIVKTKEKEKLKVCPDPPRSSLSTLESLGDLREKYGISRVAELLAKLGGKAKEDMLDLVEIDANLKFIKVLEGKKVPKLEDEVNRLRGQQDEIYEGHNVFREHPDAANDIYVAQAE
ncbi:hypothetical protein AALP_AA8G193100 [Arabis alpina]|uniref:Uncharacterized protein n=1 Tax=Arabis alpina TaxID=50452 RepID=A0A087G818_ARAAL|nr:hypothetical protein AALP_AA8G193100 [Arabis alpina]